LYYFCLGIGYNSDSDFTFEISFTINSDFGLVHFTFFRVPTRFSIYSVEVTFNTPNEFAKCALAMAVSTGYTGITEVVDV